MVVPRVNDLAEPVAVDFLDDVGDGVEMDGVEERDVEVPLHLVHCVLDEEAHSRIALSPYAFHAVILNNG